MIRPVLQHALPLAALVALLLSGCHTTTHISRQEQLSHITTAMSSATVTTEARSTTAPAAETTVPGNSTAETTSVTTQAATAPSTDNAPQSKPTRPAQTDPVTQPSVVQTQPVTPEPPIDQTEPETSNPSSDQTEPAVREPDPYDISGHSCGKLEYAILDALNAQRTAQGLEELSLSGRLSAISSVRAYETTLAFSHSRPDGRDFVTVLDDYGYGGYSRAAENLLQCSGGYTASDMVSLWMGSAGHTANILDSEFTTVGIGVYRANGMIYVATIFTG